jgi:hypothetical protein
MAGGTLPAQPSVQTVQPSQQIIGRRYQAITSPSNDGQMI